MIDTLIFINSIYVNIQFTNQFVKFTSEHNFTYIKENSKITFKNIPSHSILDDQNQDPVVREHLIDINLINKKLTLVCDFEAGVTCSNINMEKIKLDMAHHSYFKILNSNIKNIKIKINESKIKIFESILGIATIAAQNESLIKLNECNIKILKKQLNDSCKLELLSTNIDKIIDQNCEKPINSTQGNNTSNTQFVFHNKLKCDSVLLDSGSQFIFKKGISGSYSFGSNTSNSIK